MYMTSCHGYKRLAKSKGLEAGGIYNEFLAKQVAKYSEDYVPYLTGALAHSSKTDAIVPKGGYYVRWRAYSNQNGLRGSYWDRRMLADRKELIMKHLKDKMRRELKKQNG